MHSKHLKIYLDLEVNPLNLRDSQYTTTVKVKKPTNTHLDYQNDGFSIFDITQKYNGEKNNIPD